MKVTTPSGATLNFDSRFATPLWTAEARLVGDGGASFRGFQVTPISAIRAMVSDLSGKLVSELSVAGGTLSSYDLGGSKTDPPTDPAAIGPNDLTAARDLSPGVLGVWSGKTHGVFAFFYGSLSRPEGVARYYSRLRFTEKDGVRVESLVPKETLATERICIPVDRVGLFTVTEARHSRALVPRSPGRRIGPAEVWRQVYEPQAGQRQTVFVAATNTAVALFAPEWPEDHRPTDADNDKRAFGTIAEVAALDWN